MFLYSPETSFNIKTIGKNLYIRRGVLNKHVKNLLETKFIISKNTGSGKVFKVNQDFIFYNKLKELVSKATPASKEKMLKRLKSLGKIKLVLVSGVFVDLDNSQIDLLVVGDGVKLNKFNNFIGDLTAEVGKEINYALMTTKEFNYRYDMYDRFIRDLLEFKHEKLINKLKI